MSADAAHMVRLFLLLCLMLAIGGPGFAGAWLREKGAVFTAASATLFREEDEGFKFKSAFYAEWGARPKLTIGLDLEEHQDAYGHALIFARIPVAEFGKAGRLAAEFGAGVHHRQSDAWSLYKTTLSYGKGIRTRWGGGWIALDAALEYRKREGLFRKLDFTTGLSSERRLDPLLQIETSYEPGRPLYWSVRPAVIYRPRTGKTNWIIGAEKNSARDHPGLKFALWLNY